MPTKEDFIGLVREYSLPTDIKERLEKADAVQRESLLTPAQKHQKRNTPPPAEPNDLDIAIEAYNRNKPEFLTIEQKRVMHDAIRRQFVTRGNDGRLKTNFQVQQERHEEWSSEEILKLSNEFELSNKKAYELSKELGLEELLSPKQQRRRDIVEEHQEWLKEDAKSFGQKMWEDIKEHPGRTAGMVLSKPAPFATGGATMAGEAVDQHLQRLGVLEGEAPQTPEDAANRMLQAGAEGLAVGTVSKGVGKMISPFGKTVTPEGRAAMKTVRGLKGGKNLVFPIEKSTESGPIDALGNMAEVAILSSTRKIRNMEKVTGALDAALRETATKLSKGKTTEQVADTVSTIVTAGRKIYKKARNRAFEAIDELNPTIKKVTTREGFKTKALEDGTEELIQQMNPKTGIIENVPIMKTKDVITKGGVDMNPTMAFIRKALAKEEDPLKKLPEMARALKLMEEGGAVVSFKQADNTVIDLADFGFASMTATSKDQGLARVAQKMIKDAMNKAAKQLPKEAYKRFRAAKRFSQIEAITYQRNVIKGLLKDSKDYKPEQVWNMIKGAGPENIKLIRELMQPRKFIKESMIKATGRKPADKTIKEQTFWQNVQGRFLSDLMKTSEGEIRQKPIINKIDDAILSGRFKEMFPGPRGNLAAENFKRLAEAKNVILRPNPTGRTGLMVQVGQPMQALTIMGGGITALAGEPEVGAGIMAGGVGLFLLPEALAQLVTRKGLSKWLINQSKAAPIFSKGTQTIFSFGNLLGRENIDFEILAPGDLLPEQLPGTSPQDGYLLPGQIID